MKTSLRLVVALVSCTLGCGPAGDPDAGPVDAGVGDAGPSLGEIACTDAFAAGGANKLYLNFDGASVKAGLFTVGDDASADTSSLIVEDATFPAWRDGEAAREAAIADIRCAVRRELDPYDVEVTLTRPATGPFQMVVFGGSLADVGDASDARVPRSPNCVLSRNVLALIGETGSDGARLNDVRTANLVLGALGIMNGLKGSFVTSNCTCGWSTDCVQAGANVCTFSEVDAHPDGDACATSATVDQRAVLTEHYGARP